jgi:hypothetical protein
MSDIMVDASAVAYAKSIGEELTEIDRAFWGIYKTGQTNPELAANELVRHCRKLLREAEMLRFCVRSYILKDAA